MMAILQSRQVEVGCLAAVCCRPPSATASSSSDDLPVCGQREQHDHYDRHGEGQADEPYQKAHDEPADLGKSWQSGQGRENEKEVKHPVRLSSMLNPRCGRDAAITTQRPANVLT